MLSTGSRSFGTAGTALIQVQGSYGFPKPKLSNPSMLDDAIACPSIRTREYMSASSGPGSPSPCDLYLTMRRRTMRVSRWSG